MPVDFERDVPTTADDIAALRRLRAQDCPDLTTQLDRLTRAVRALSLRPGRSTAAGRPPFEL
jgi:hypothetical protein